MCRVLLFAVERRKNKRSFSFGEPTEVAIEVGRVADMLMDAAAERKMGIGGSHCMDGWCVNGAVAFGLRGFAVSMVWCPLKGNVDSGIDYCT